MPDNNANDMTQRLPQVPTEFQGKDTKIKGTKDKPTLKNKVMSFLSSDRIDSIGSYLYNYVLKPGFIYLLWQVGTNALSMTLLGGNNQAQPNMGGGGFIPGYGYQPARRDPVPYQSYGSWQAQQPGYGYAQPQSQPSVISNMPGQYLNLNDISFTSRDDAWMVLDRMGNELRRYGRVRVADFYNAAGITGQEGNWTLTSTGWTNLATAQPKMRTDGRWIIEFPPTQVI